MATTLLLATLLAGAPSAGPPRAPTSFDEVLGLAEAHPGLAADDAAIAARARRDEELSSVTANPTIQVLPGWRLPGSGDPGFEMQASVSQPLDTGGLGGARRRAAAAERAALEGARRARALALRIDAARAWVALWASEAALVAMKAELELAEELARHARRAVELGAALEPGALEARLFAATLKKEVLDAEGVVYERALELADALGRAGDRLLTAEGGPPALELPDPETWPQWIERAGRLPAAERARLAARAASARVLEEQSAASARIAPTITAQWERPHDVLVFGGVSVQLPLFEVNARARALAEAEDERARGASQRAERGAERALRGALHEVEHAREIAEQLEAHILPAAGAWVEAARRRFDAGESDLFPVLRARQRLAAGRLAAVRAEERRAWAETKAWLLLASIPREEERS